MQLSSLLYHKTTHEITFPPDTGDPDYFLDLKEHLNKNPEYRKQRIAWRNTRPASHDMTRIKLDFFDVYRENEMNTFWNDILLSINQYPELPAGELAKMFCAKWKGYEKTYGIEFVERAIRRCQNGNRCNQPNPL